MILHQNTLIAYRIFSLYQENTKTIHLIMMIWLVNFIVSNYKLASSPPKDPGGIKNIFSNQKDIDSQNFLRKSKLSDPFPNEWYMCFHSLCSICHKKLCIFLPKRKKNWDEGYDMMGHIQGSTREQFCIKNCRDSKTKVREKKLSSYQAFLGRRGREVVKVTIIQTDFNCLVLREAFCVVKFLKSVSN